MNIKERIIALSRLGEHLLQPDDYLDAIIHRTEYNNAWFTKENQRLAIQAIATKFLDKNKLEKWTATYPIAEAAPMKTVGMVMAGNLPLVGFHDLVCTFVAGHKAKIKLSDKDRYLLPYLLQLLEKYTPGTGAYFEIVEQLSGYDAVIATGSNNSARYFEAYFGKYPHIIRKNRNAVAVLDGSETADELLALGKDVFQFFGLGCRNVSKLYLPQGYHFQALMESLHEYNSLANHSKYRNNFDYNLALLMLNQVPYFNNGCIIVAENKAIASRIAMLHYEFYEDITSLVNELANRREEIQCIVAKPKLLSLPTIAFGKTQEPGLMEYPDGVDVMGWLINI
ncbi:MAG: acyl-CoA reductase [Saprospiraceae bacterium]|nr:acyl-CoA reductase [Saprospiraceae bacterium]